MAPDVIAKVLPEDVDANIGNLPISVSTLQATRDSPEIVTRLKPDARVCVPGPCVRTAKPQEVATQVSPLTVDMSLWSTDSKYWRNVPPFLSMMPKEVRVC